MAARQITQMTRCSGYRNLLWQLANRWMVVLLSLCALSACHRDSSAPQSIDSLVPPTVWKHLESDIDKVCAERAYRKIKDLGKTYHFTVLPGLDEAIKDIWIGDKLLRIPRQYIVSVNYGSGHLTEVPGLNILMYGWLPDMRVSSKGDPHPDDTRIDVRISCWPSITAISPYQLPMPEKLTQALPEMGLVGKGNYENGVWIYTPTDENIKNFNGRFLQFSCNNRYSPATPERIHDRCSSGFALRDGAWVAYSFRQSILPSWRNINEQVIRLTESFLAERG